MDNQLIVSAAMFTGSALASLLYGHYLTALALAICGLAVISIGMVLRRPQKN